MTSSDTAIHATHTLQASQAAEEAALLSRTLQESLLPPHLPAIPGIGHHGIILGYLPAPRLRDQRTVLRHGDTLVMYTTGPAVSAADVAASVGAAVLDFSGRRITDDTAVLALRVIPISSAG
jgi:hypothetical protein